MCIIRCRIINWYSMQEVDNQLLVAKSRILNLNCFFYQDEFSGQRWSLSRRRVTIYLPSTFTHSTIRQKFLARFFLYRGASHTVLILLYLSDTRAAWNSPAKTENDCLIKRVGCRRARWQQVPVHLWLLRVLMILVLGRWISESRKKFLLHSSSLLYISSSTMSWNLSLFTKSSFSETNF